MMPSFRQRWLDVVAAIYIYNEHRGYTALDKVLYAVRRHFTDDHRLIAEIEQHRADERKHYLMFKRWFEKRGQMPLDVDSTCGHIDRFVELVFRKRIDDLDLDAFIEQGHFAELCAHREARLPAGRSTASPPRRPAGPNAQQDLSDHPRG
jgi:hypothetical protein